MKTEYETLKKKYKKLPDFDKLNHYFEITDLEKNDFVLRNIRKKIMEKLALYVDILEGTLQPETSVCAMHESKFIGENERQIAAEIYVLFAQLQREAIELSIEENDEETADFISKVFDAYLSKKDKLRKVVKFLKESWNKKETGSEEIEYLR